MIADIFASEGFVHVPAVCAQAAVALAEMLDRGLVVAANELGVDPHRYARLVSAWGLGHSEVRAAVTRVSPLIEDLAALLGGDEVLDATVFFKSGTSPSPTHAHQDVSYRWRSDARRYALTTWVALDDCDAETGALTFLPGSHRGPIEVRQDELSAVFVDRAQTSAWLSSARAVNVRRGDVIAFDARTWHSALPFRRDGLRRALALRWTGPACEQWLVPAPRIDPVAFGMETAGALLVSALTAFTLLDLPAEVDRALVVARPRLIGLDAHVTAVLEDLGIALGARAHHHARPHDHNLWCAVRDIVIPALFGRASHGDRA